MMTQVQFVSFRFVSFRFNSFHRPEEHNGARSRLVRTCALAQRPGANSIHSAASNGIRENGLARGVPWPLAYLKGGRHSAIFLAEHLLVLLRSQHRCLPPAGGMRCQTAFDRQAVSHPVVKPSGSPRCCTSYYQKTDSGRQGMT